MCVVWDIQFSILISSFIVGCPYGLRGGRNLGFVEIVYRSNAIHFFGQSSLNSSLQKNLPNLGILGSF